MYHLSIHLSLVRTVHLEEERIREIPFRILASKEGRPNSLIKKDSRVDEGKKM